MSTSFGIVTVVGFYRDFGRQLSQTGVGVEKVTAISR